MKKSHTKVFVVLCLICILLTCVMLSACKDNYYGNNFYNVTYYDYHKAPSSFNIRADEPKRIDTLEQLKTLCSESNIHVYDKNSTEYDFYKKLRNYDKKFFKNKSLIFLLKAHGRGWWEYDLGKIELKDDTMSIYTLCDNGLGYERSQLPEYVTHYVWVIEIDKSAIKDIKNIVVKNYRTTEKEEDEEEWNDEWLDEWLENIRK